MRHIIRWGNSDSEKQSDLELLVKLNTHFIGELIKRVDESVGVLIPRIKRLKTSARTKKDGACESEVLKCNLCKKLWFDVCEEIILTTLSNQIYWLNEQDTTQGFPKLCLSDWLISISEAVILIPISHLLQMLRSLSWHDLSLDTRAAHRSGSLRPSKLSSSAATLLRLSSAYLELKYY